MPAREKLNGAYAAGSVVLAAILGTVTESGAVFFLALIVLLVLNCISGEIRFKK